MERSPLVKKAQLAILNEKIIQMTPAAFKQFEAALEAQPTPITDKMRERLSRKAPWNNAL